MPEFAPSRQRLPIDTTCLPPPDMVPMMDAPPPMSLPSSTMTPALMRPSTMDAPSDAGVEIAEAFMQHRGAGRQVRAQPHAGRVGDAHA